MKSLTTFLFVTMITSKLGKAEQLLPATEFIGNLGKTDNVVMSLLGGCIATKDSVNCSDGSECCSGCCVVGYCLESSFC